MKPKGYFWCCRSRFDGRPLVVIITAHSTNKKTGDMLQTWILRADTLPTVAVKCAEDVSICGDCPRRHSLGGDCYVVVARAPQTVYRAWRRGRYPELDLGNPEHVAHLSGRLLRLGAYGDPAAVPAADWERLIETIRPRAWTGYTHAWHRPGAEAYRGYCMASVDTASQQILAQALGWRTFRARRGTEPLLPGEFECPASSEQGFRLTCATCKACNGNPHGRLKAGNPVIIEHGALSLAAAKHCE